MIERPCRYWGLLPTAPLHAEEGGGTRLRGEVTLAVRSALRGDIAACGFVVVGPYLPWPEPYGDLLKSGDARPVRGTVIIGERDALGLEGARGLAALMEQAGLPCHLEVVPALGHEYPTDFVERLRSALAFGTASS